MAVLNALVALMTADLDHMVGAAYRKAWQGFHARSGEVCDATLRREFVHREMDEGGVAGRFFRVVPMLLEQRSRQLVEAYRELVRRLHHDAEGMYERFGVRLPLTALEGGVSDSHRGGRQVLICTFAGGGRVVYKPRPVVGEVAWYRLCGLLETTESPLGLFAANAWDKGSYGWMEHVPCSGEGHPPFETMRQLGVLVAVLHRLGATDMHQENVYLSTRGPVLVDGETLISPGLEAVPGPPVAMARFEDNVLATGSVINWLEQVTGRWTAVGTIGSVMAQLRRRGFGTDGLLNALAEGYRQGAAAVTTAVRRMGGAEKLLERIGLDAVCLRYLARPTRVYSRLLAESVRPTNLRSTEQRADCVAKLYAWAHRTGSELVHSIVDQEYRDLSAGDIPYFGVESDTNVLRGYSGQAVGELQGESARQRALRKLAERDGEDLERQVAILRSALRPPTMPGVRDAPEDGDPLDDGDVDRMCAVVAREYAEDGLRRAVTGRSMDRPIGATVNAWTGRVTVNASGWGLYAGLSGTALAYASTGALLAETRYVEAARRTAAALAELEPPDDYRAWHGLSAHVSDLYGIALARRLCSDIEMTHRIDMLVQHLYRVRRHLGMVEHHDVVGGLAGALLALVAVAEDGVAVDDLVVEIYSHVASPMVPAAETEDLGSLGMAHGKIGLCFAAARAASHLGDELAAEAWIEDLLHTGQRLLSVARHQRDYGAVSWCRGVAGLLSALLAVESRTGEAYSLTWTGLTWLCRNQALGEGRGLCCGYASIVDVLATARAAPQYADHPDLPERERLLRAWLAQPHNPRLPSEATFLGAWQGSAGIAYTALRLCTAGATLPSLGSLTSSLSAAVAP